MKPDEQNHTDLDPGDGESRVLAPSGRSGMRLPGFSQELVVQFVAGDREAFLRVFEQLKDTVFYQARRYFARPFDQEEAFQEAWLQVYRRRSAFDVNRHRELGGWVRRVARNRCLDLLKARGRGRELPVEEPEAPPTEASQHEELAGARLREALEAFVSKLDEQQQRHFALCLVQELSHEDVARQMDITVRRSKYLKKKTVTAMLRSPALRRARENR